MLKCTKCLLDKDEGEFTYSATAPSRGFKHYWCRVCNSQHYEDNKERHKASSRANSIKKRYGLTVPEYEALMAQGCSICGESEKRIVLDHCHATNCVRQPLCDLCNVALGAARDNPSLLRAMAEYVERHSAP